jgi:hypothetical protein
LKTWHKIGGLLKHISNPLEELNCKLPKNFLPRIESLASTLGSNHKWEVIWCRNSLLDDVNFCAIKCIKCNEKYIFSLLKNNTSFANKDIIFGFDWITEYSKYDCDENIIKHIIE